MNKLGYKDAGVDIDAGNEFVDCIKPYISETFDKHVIGGIGSFAGAYELPSAYKKPVLLGATDGVGTKLRLAIQSGKLDTVGIDLVAMCVNDLICNFAVPAFFLDYYAMAKLDVQKSVQILKGIVEGCKKASCSLIGGESAEMPGMYSKDDFDLAGFAVGIAEKEELDRSLHVKSGDVLVALPSSGVHSNGFSLVRKVFFDKLGMSLDDEFEGRSLSEVLLEPTRIYVDEFKQNKHFINALAHITGGGLLENVPRMLPINLDAKIEKASIKSLKIFDFLNEYVEPHEMLRTFNLGIGLLLSIDAKNVDNFLSNTDGYVVGEVVKGSKKTILV